MCQPTIKDSAEYFRLSVEAGVRSESEVVTWADQMISGNDADLPDWLLELSTNKYATISRLLREVPGDSNQAIVWKMVLAGIGRTKQTGKLSREQVVRIIYRWAVNEELPDEYIRDGYRLDDQWELVVSGFATESQFEKDVDEFFEQFIEFEEFIPDSYLKTTS